MEILGCTNPAATNYNGAATQDDGSCIYLMKIGSTCYAFQDEPSLRDESFTMSYALDGTNWIFFHDYIPDFYFATRERLFSLKSSRIYKHNEGPPGQYYDGTIKPFFIDVVMRFESDRILNTVKWMSEVFTSLGAEKGFETITHVTIWNNQQCSGKIALSDIKSGLEYVTNSKTRGEWVFNAFRDLVLNRDSVFIDTLFQDFRPDPNQLATSRPWWKNGLMDNSYFIVRLEYDNTSGNTLFLHGVDADTDQSPR